MKIIAPLAVLLAACSQSPSETARANEASTAAAKKPAVQAPAPKPFSVSVENDLIEFDYSWPAEVSAIPLLAQRLAAHRDKTKAELIANAEDDKAMRDKQGFDYHPHSSSTSYETAGQSARLLSLLVEAGGYEGGAHPNSGTNALLWDRKAAKEINFADLFAARANRDRLLTQRWCDSLNKQREEKRGEPVGGDGMFDDCPPLDEIAIIPTDSNKDGRFEKLLLVASPYVAGPYVEDSYEVELAVTSDLIAGLKMEYQPSFAAQGAQ